MASVRSYPIPDSRMPFVNGEFAEIERAGKPLLATSVVAGKNTGRFYLIDPWTGACELHQLPADEWGAYVLKKGPDGRLYMGTLDGNLVRYDPKTGKTETLCKGELSSIAWGGCITQQYMVWSASPGETCVYDWREDRLVHTLKPFDIETPAARYGHGAVETPDGKILFGMNVPQARLILLDPQSGTRRSILPECLKGREWTRDPLFHDAQTFSIFSNADLFFFEYPSFKLLHRVPPPKECRNIGGKACFVRGALYALADPVPNLLRLKPDRSGWDVAFANLGGDMHGMLWPLQDRYLCFVSNQGEFKRLDTETGECFTHWLEAIGPVGSHALCPVPKLNKIFGAPFINMRFWEVDGASGKGRDLGRASMGGGQVNYMAWDEQTQHLCMACYTSCTISVYDPAKPGSYPENPKVLCKVEEHQMRPKALAHDGRQLWMASSAYYGHLGGALSRIDPLDGSYRCWRNIVPDQTPNRVVVDSVNQRLYVSTEIYADCESAPPTQKTAKLFAFDIQELKIVAELAPYENAPALSALALLKPGKVLVAGPERLGSWEPATGKFEDLGAKPKGMKEAVAAPDGRLFSSFGGAVGRLHLESGGVRLETLDPVPGKLLTIAGGKLWYTYEQEVRAVEL